MKNKYNDNKLAEEFDLIVLTGNEHELQGLPCGSLGTLTYSYTGFNRPLYAEFAAADGTRFEEPLALCDFRVLDEQNPHDLSVIATYLRAKSRVLLDKTEQTRYTTAKRGITNENSR